jgi:hypothetical protein
MAWRKENDFPGLKSKNESRQHNLEKHRREVDRIGGVEDYHLSEPAVPIIPALDCGTLKQAQFLDAEDVSPHCYLSYLGRVADPTKPFVISHVVSNESNSLLIFGYLRKP